MKMSRNSLVGVLLISALVSVVLWTVTSADLPAVLLSKGTPTRTPTEMVPTITSTVLLTLPPPTASLTPAPPLSVPNPSAPLCATHVITTFHVLWNESDGCHYDHEHGTDYRAFVASTFPLFDSAALLCGNEISHCNPSSAHENSMKHGGHKWQTDAGVPCEVFEGAAWCVTDAAIQYHWFGDAAIEMESRVHSALAFVKACDPSAPTDCGYAFIDQHVDYGQRVSQYQGELMPYPDNPSPAYAVNFGPYFTIDRFGTCTGCRPSLAFVVTRRANANGVWTTKATGGVTPFGSTLLAILIRSRDMYQLKNNSDNTYPFTFGWLCSPGTNGLTYAPAACRYTNSTGRVHEIAGVIPAEWDNLAGFDTNPTVGRITTEGYVTRFGTLGLECIAVEIDCHPIQLLNMFVGKYGGQLPGAKVSNPNSVSNPSRNIFFCAGVVCVETAPNAIPSGWIGAEN